MTTPQQDELTRLLTLARRDVQTKQDELNDQNRRITRHLESGGHVGDLEMRDFEARRKELTAELKKREEVRDELLERLAGRLQSDLFAE